MEYLLITKRFLKTSFIIKEPDRYHLNQETKANITNNGANGHPDLLMWSWRYFVYVVSLLVICNMDPLLWKLWGVLQNTGCILQKNINMKDFFLKVQELYKRWKEAKETQQGKTELDPESGEKLTLKGSVETIGEIWIWTAYQLQYCISVKLPEFDDCTVVRKENALVLRT